MLSRLLISGLIFLALGLNMADGQTQSFIHKKFSPGQLKEDATVVRDVILRMHPVIGIYGTRAYYDKLFDDYVNSFTDSLTEKQFRIRTKQVLEKLHCGHTDIMYSEKYLKALKKTKFNFPRYYLAPIDDKVYVLGGLNRKADTILRPGTRITKINGVPADSFYRFAQSLITIDGYISESKKLYGQMGYSSYYLTLLNYPDTISYEYIANGKTGILKSAAYNAVNIPDFSWRRKDDSLFTRYKRAKLRYRYVDEDKKTMHLNVQGFSPRKYSKAYRKIFRQLKKNNTENLIIDLRFNGGGSLTNSEHFLKYLLDKPVTQTSYTAIKKYPLRKYTKGQFIFKITRLYFKLYGKDWKKGDTTFYTIKIKPRKRNHYDKKIYVLTNGGSFSASCLVAAYLKETNRATVIGRETGGTIEGCNAVITPYYKLPNTRTKVRVPTFRLLHDVYTKGNTGHGIIPDHETNYTFKDIIMKKDLEMEKAMELIIKK